MVSGGVVILVRVQVALIRMKTSAAGANVGDSPLHIRFGNVNASSAPVVALVNTAVAAAPTMPALQNCAALSPLGTSKLTPKFAANLRSETRVSELKNRSL